MSRPEQRTNSAPVKVVVQGVDPGSPLYRHVLEGLSGELNRFYRGAAQQQDLSEAPSGSRIRQLPGGGMMRYSNNGGLETLTVALSAEEITYEQALVPKDKEAPDYCVVDIVVKNSVHVEGSFIIEVKSPKKMERTESPHPSPSGKPEVVDFPYSVPTEGASIAIPNRVCSIRFDLRGLGDAGTAEVDVYGHVVPEEYPQIGTEIHGYTRTVKYPWTIKASQLHNYTSYYHPSDIDSDGLVGHTDPLDFAYQTNDNWSSWDGSFSSSDACLIASRKTDEIQDLYRPMDGTVFSGQGPARIVQTFDPTSGLVYKEKRAFVDHSDLNIVIGDGVPCTHDGHSSLEWSRWVSGNLQEREWNIVPNETPIYDDKYSAPCDVTYAFYWGDPHLRHAPTPHKDATGIWAFGKEVTERKQIGTATVDDQDYEHNPSQYRYLGRITIDRAGASAKFKAGPATGPTA